MALIQCPECGSNVSNSANKCPTCGYSIRNHLRQADPKRKATKKKIITVLLLVLIGFSLFNIYSTLDKAKYKNFADHYGPHIFNKQDLGEESGVDVGSSLWFFEWKTGEYKYRYHGVVWEHDFKYKLHSDSITIYDVDSWLGKVIFNLEGTYPIKEIDGSQVIVFNEDPQCYYKK